MTIDAEIATAASADARRIDEALARLQRLARLLDSAVPVGSTGVRLGADALIGLVPAIGDAAGVLLSCFIVFEAARLGAPRRVLVRMMSNIGADALIGLVPLLGDVADVAIRVNDRNVALLAAHRDSLRLTEPLARLRSTLLLLAIGTGLFVAATAVAGIWLGLSLLRAMSAAG